MVVSICLREWKIESRDPPLRARYVDQTLALQNIDLIKRG